MIDREVPTVAPPSRRRRRPASGMNRAIASATSRSSAAIPMRCANGATWASTNAAASGDNAEGGLRDPAGPPGLEVTGLHPCPAAGQSVLQLDRRRNQRPAGVGGAADRERELGDAELRDQRRTLAGQREAGVAGRGDPGGCLVDRLRWVLLGPGHRGDHQVCLRLVGCGLAFAGEHQHVTRGVKVPAFGVGGCCHE